MGQMEAESLIVVLELDYLAGLQKALQSYRDERVIFHGPSEFRARTGKSIWHGTQVGVKASRLCVNQLLDRAAGSLAKYFLSILMTFPSAIGRPEPPGGHPSCAADFKQFRSGARLGFQQF